MWGLTIPQFSRGRYISNRQLETYNVGLLYPPPIPSPRNIHRAIFVYNEGNSNINVTLDVAGPFPAGRPETLQIALGSSSPAFYVEFLADEGSNPPIVGSWGTSLSLIIPPQSAFPIWLRLSFTPTSTPTEDSYFILRVNNQPSVYIVYSYQRNRVILPQTLWQATRNGLRVSNHASSAGETPAPIYIPKGFLLSSQQSVSVLYPLVDKFAESDYAKKIINVLAIAIAEFWLRADAEVRLSDSIYARRGDTAALFAIPETIKGDALVYLNNLVSQRRGDALANFAVELIERLGDALANISSDVFSRRADALTHLGWERLLRGDGLSFIAIDVASRRGDALARFHTTDDILGLDPLPTNSIWGVSLIPPLSFTTVFVAFESASAHITSVTEESRVRLLYSPDGVFWQPLAIVPIYSNKFAGTIQRGYLRFRNERDEWAVVIWALIPYSP